MSRSLPKRLTALPVLAAVAAGLTACALINHRAAKQAEQRHPPSGRFIEIDGVRLHYIERGRGQPLVLVHGNGSMIADFESSGLIALAGRNYRVIVFDRPGYGYSSRPRTRIWTAGAQADLFRKALVQMGASPALVLGHSWGSLVALELALRHPEAVSGLILCGGYYYPSARLDALLASTAAVPVLGDIMCATAVPVLSRMLWRRFLRKIFAPAPIPAKFRRFPKEMALRPVQLRTAAAESGLLLPVAFAGARRYSGVQVPVGILAGADDRLISTKAQSVRLHRVIPHSTFKSTPGAGHMIHQTDPQAVMEVIDKVAARC